MLSDSIYISTKSFNPRSKPSSTVIIHLIPGNPGLIEYYRDFLNHLANTLESRSGSTRYVLSAQSLAGFELNHGSQERSKPPPYTLEEQISNVHSQIRESVAAAESKNKPRNEESEPSGSLRAVLIGHSVGAYIMLEIIASRQRAQRDGKLDKIDQSYDVVGGISLFPTVVDIAKSSNGKITTPLVTIPGFAFLIHWLAKLLCLLIPSSMLEMVVQYVTGMPEAPARTTKAFIESQHGVYQALYMTKYEMLEITRDKWENDIWDNSLESNSPSASTTTAVKTDKPNLYFYWGENDRWVDNRTRDGLVITRARQVEKAGGEDEGKPYMEIDMLGVPHAFCIRHSEPIAEKVAVYIEEITSVRNR